LILLHRELQLKMIIVQIKHWSYFEFCTLSHSVASSIKPLIILISFSVDNPGKRGLSVQVYYKAPPR